MRPFWGIDLGGTKIELAVFRVNEKPEILYRKRTATPSEKTPGSIFLAIAGLVEEAQRELKLRAQQIGVCHPGVIDPLNGLLRNSNTTSLNGLPFQQELARAIPLPARFANDANCFALAEERFGAARGAQSVFGIILGTGVGGGLVIRGQIVAGLHGIAGEWGHNPLIENGDPCFCGRSGCTETVISGTALEKFYYQQTGEKRTLEEIAQRVPDDAQASITLDRLVSYFSRALGTVINIVDPEVVVIGGGVGKLDCLYSKAPQILNQFCMYDAPRTRILKPVLGDSAGVFGAGLLWEDDASQPVK